MTKEAHDQIAEGLREATLPMFAWQGYEPPLELIDRALAGEGGAIRILMFSCFSKGYLAAIDDLGPTDEQILAAYNQGRKHDLEIDRDVPEISGGDISQLDIEME